MSEVGQVTPRGRHAVAGVGRTVWVRRVPLTASAGLALITIGMAGGVAPTPASAQTATPNVGALLVRSGEMPGFEPTGSPQTWTGAAQYVSQGLQETGKKASADLKEFTDAGLIATAWGNLSGPGGDSGANEVWYLKSSAAARRLGWWLYASTAASGRQTPGSTLHTFKAGIAGGKAYTISNSQGSANDVYFAHGRCVFFVGDSVSSSPAESPSVVVSASKAVEKRTSATCA